MASAHAGGDDREIDLEATSDGSDEGEDSMDVNNDRQRQLDERKREEAEKAQQKPKRVQKPRAPKLKLTAESLIEDPNGFPYIASNFYDEFSAGYKGKGHEIADLGLLLGMYARWQKRFFPSLEFDDFLLQVEKFSSNNKMRDTMKNRRKQLIYLPCVMGSHPPRSGWDDQTEGGGRGEEEGNGDGAADPGGGAGDDAMDDDEDYQVKAPQVAAPAVKKRTIRGGGDASHDEGGEDEEVDPMDELMEIQGPGGGDEDEEEMRRREEEEAALDAMDDDLWDNDDPPPPAPAPAPRASLRDPNSPSSISLLQKTQVLSIHQTRGLIRVQPQIEEEDDQELMDLLEDEEEEEKKEDEEWGGMEASNLLPTQVLHPLGGEEEDEGEGSGAVVVKRRQVFIDSEDED